MSTDTPGRTPVVHRRPPLFRALGPNDPPMEIDIGGQTSIRSEILKHDSWAATAIYGSPTGKVVCKFNRTQAIAGFPTSWLGRWLARREAAMLGLLSDLDQVPPGCGPVRVDGQVCAHAVAHEYIEGHPLAANERVGNEFFPLLRDVLVEVHRRGIAYMDLHKRENILVDATGGPVLIDFQVCFWLPRGRFTRWLPLRGLLHLLQRADFYHLAKHIARNRPDQAVAESAESCPWLIRMHRVVAQPLRRFRRQLLVWCGVRAGRGDAFTELEPEDAIRRERPGLAVLPVRRAA